MSEENINTTKTLEDLIAECQMDTGIADLASQHDTYLYGKPRRESEEEIDMRVIAQADDDEAWEDFIVHRAKSSQTLSKVLDARSDDKDQGE